MKSRRFKMMLPWQVQAGSYLNRKRNLLFCFVHHLKQQNRLPKSLTVESILFKTRGGRTFLLCALSHSGLQLWIPNRNTSELLKNADARPSGES